MVLLLYRKIRLKNIILKKQKDEIETQSIEIKNYNIQITDSINYARRLQHAVIVPSEFIKKYMPQSFVYFKPRDIVSGVFYWFTVKNNLIIYAVADCTGHGVPGALLSMIDNTLLNKIVIENNHTEPDEIFNRLHKGVTDVFSKRADFNETEDGMDITLITINPISKKINVSAAKNNLVVLKNGTPEYINADFFSIGQKPIREGQVVKFSKNEVDYDENTKIYMLTDGFTDQFNSDNNEKFGSKRFNNLITDNKNLPVSNQLNLIEQKMDEWKKSNEQTDDMLIVGIGLSEIKI